MTRFITMPIPSVIKHLVQSGNHYIIKGYAINQKRLDNYNELKEVVRLMSRAITLQDQVSEGEYNGLFNVISDYVYALDTLDKYD